ncbi:ferredoxin [Rhodococcus ruber]|uniref:Ferredoxin n=1 Tax=Rhodococcus ruber TaxID=1830 RepID=A0ABT4MLA1_9NOCA|nr:ferredoxin [Rhodococcus ruber]MCZ4521758.1 ferredoxin [Rhodococcus ruber]
MKIHLDADRCEGYGFCEEKAPRLVALDDSGDLVVLEGGELNGSDVDDAHKAVRSCPVAALRLIESHDA